MGIQGRRRWSVLRCIIIIALVGGSAGCDEAVGPEDGPPVGSPSATRMALISNPEAPWPTEGHDLGRTQQSQFLGPPIEPTAELVYDAGEPIIHRSPIITAANEIVLSLCGPEVVAIGLDGSPAWSYSLANTGNRESSVGITQGPSGDLYVGVHDCPDIPGGVGGSLYSLTSGGASRWVRGSPMQYFAPAVTSEAVYQIDEYNKVWALRLDGTPWWDEDLASWANGGVTLDDAGNLYLGTDGGMFSGHSLTSMSPDGTVRWRTLGSPGINASNAVIGPTGGVYVLNSENGTLHSFDQDTGVENWESFSGSGRANRPSIAVGTSGTVYFRTSDGVFAINADGSLKWSKNLSDATPQKGSPILDREENVYVGVGDEVISYDSEGHERWRIDLPDVSYLLVGAEGVLYAVSGQQLLYEARATDQTPRVNFFLHEPEQGAVVRQSYDVLGLMNGVRAVKLAQGETDLGEDISRWQSLVEALQSFLLFPVTHVVEFDSNFPMSSDDISMFIADDKDHIIEAPRDLIELTASATRGRLIFKRYWFDEAVTIRTAVRLPNGQVTVDVWTFQVETRWFFSSSADAAEFGVAETIKRLLSTTLKPLVDILLGLWIPQEAF